jgi:hypothetical protein
MIERMVCKRYGQGYSEDRRTSQRRCMDRRWHNERGITDLALRIAGVLHGVEEGIWSPAYYELNAHATVVMNPYTNDESLVGCKCRC